MEDGVVKKMEVFEPSDKINMLFNKYFLLKNKNNINSNIIQTFNHYR